MTFRIIYTISSSIFITIDLHYFSLSWLITLFVTDSERKYFELTSFSRMSNKVNPLSILGEKPGSITKLPLTPINPKFGDFLQYCFKVSSFLRREKPFDILKDKNNGADDLNDSHSFEK